MTDRDRTVATCATNVWLSDAVDAAVTHEHGGKYFVRIGPPATAEQLAGVQLIGTPTQLRSLAFVLAQAAATTERMGVLAEAFDDDDGSGR